ncbi:MAG: CCC motif membrane protein [Bacteroidales bacterium]|nr:CCC motif membrane protein [Bacteroidales bacterium]
MEQNITNPSLNNDKSSEQQNIPYIPNISSIPPIPDLENTQNVSDTNNAPNQQSAQNDQSKGFGPSHLDYAKQQDQYANQNLGYANNNTQNNPTQQRNFVYNPTNILLNIPNSGGILTLGILSIVSLCCCGGFLAPILSIIALAMIPKAKRIYFINPQSYKISSLNNIKAGQICAIIGLAIAAIFWIYLIILMIVDGISFNEVNEAINEAWNQTGY